MFQFLFLMIALSAYTYFKAKPEDKGKTARLCLICTVGGMVFIGLCMLGGYVFATIKLASQ